MLLPFLLWVNVLWGFLINIVIDAVDGDIMQRLGCKRDWYQRWDKRLDMWFYVFLLVYGWLNFKEIWFLKLFLLTFLWRLVGELMFELSGKEWLLLVFLNIFSELFLLRAVFGGVFSFNFLLPGPWPAIIGLLLYGLVKEWWIHVGKIDLTDLLTGKRHKW